MRSFLTAPAVFVFLAPSFLPGQSSLIAPAASVGNNLETSASVTLSQPAPDAGVDVTLRSGDPARLRIAKGPDQPGAESLTLKVRQGYRETQEFWLQALSGTGSVEYTASAPGFTSANGTVTLTPSAIVLWGPFKAPNFQTTSGAAATKITVSAARLDASLKYAEEQLVAGGRSVKAEIVSSNATAGALALRSLEIRGGTSSESTRFQPAGEGETTLSLKLPAGFSTPAESGTLKALVRKPGLGLSDQLAIGQNLQVGGVLSLGEAAPAAGLHVTLVSEDPSHLLLSPSANAVGSKSITVVIPADAASGFYFLQAIGSSGTVEYTATAPGFRARTAVITLTPSGVMLTPASQGPPDEAQVLRKEAPDGTHRFASNLSKPTPTTLIAWTAQLDPITHRGADITVQPLRAGLKLTIPLSNSNPAVGSIASSVTIEGGVDHGAAEFTPLGVGSAEITIATPKDFTPSANSTMVVAVVRN